MNMKRLDNNERAQHAVNLLCEGTVIAGDIRTGGDIRIDGSVRGNVLTSGRLVVGSTADVEGDIGCRDVDVLGTVRGNIAASGTVVLKSSAHVKGDVSAAVLSVEAGSVLEGNVRMIKKETK